MSWAQPSGRGTDDCYRDRQGLALQSAWMSEVSGETPCCSDLLLEVMTKVSYFMRTHNVSHFITYGRCVCSLVGL